ncbi:pseudouridine synthase [Oceanospirillum linum]|uniref:Pseudouridine synthase n=1 Tax=Oceanospirillum linum TaxID=966 RepID=A0A1T1HDD2_OCELI|nr:pseudouridine synthase [Oceanospirillum linum]OOV87823.1 pseudouridine synthase [Oceanospirillum linum]SEG11111.1 ribosomal large subunit pseudouridine synthase E [Oleiphilus messinensis]SMP09157.1 ribosomal large subunit pseudouridine synthase E [Oceanospirillum linum]
MSRLILFNKPFQVLSQFTDSEGRNTLADFITEPGIYPAGRLDYDSEGLLLLTNDGKLQHRIASPDMKLPKTYIIQVEGDITEEALQQLRRGVSLKDGQTRPAKARKIDNPEFPPRNPPVRERKNIPTSWVELIISEGRNRQVRRMSAAVGFPTLRLIRTCIGSWKLDNLKIGEHKEIDVNLPVVTKPTSGASKNGSRARNTRSNSGKNSNRPHSKSHNSAGNKRHTGKPKR